MVGYRKELFAGAPDIPAITGLPMDVDIIDPRDKTLLSFLGRLEGDALSDTAQSILDYKTHLVGEPFDPKKGRYSETYRSDAGDCKVTFDKNGNTTQFTLKLAGAAIDKAVNSNIEQLTNGKYHNVAELRALLHGSELMAHDPNLDLPRSLLDHIDALKKEWTFSFDKDGNIASMTVDGKKVPQDSALWAIGDTLQKAQNNGLLMDGHLSGPYNPINDLGGETPDGRPTDVAAASPKHTKPHRAPVAPG